MYFLLSAFLAYFSIFLWKITPKSWIFEENTLCKKYPLNEKRAFFAFFLIFFMLLYSYKGEYPLSFAFLILIFIQQCLSDAFYRILQDQWTVILALLGIFFCKNLKNSLMFAAILFALWFLMAVIHKGEILGLGDIKLFASLILLFGNYAVFKIMLYSSLFSGFWAFLLLLFKKVNKEDRISFGPFICIACVYYLLSTSYI